jgi:hypothetical protein
MAARPSSTIDANTQAEVARYEDDCLQLIAELKAKSSPAAQTLPGEADRAVIAAMDGRAYKYHRVGYDHRSMVFRGDGTFASGGAGCERYWTIRDRRLLIAGDDGRLTMDLASARGGRWVGGAL